MNTPEEELNNRLAKIEDKLSFILDGMHKMTRVILNIDKAFDLLMEEKKLNE